MRLWAGLTPALLCVEQEAGEGTRRSLLSGVVLSPCGGALDAHRSQCRLMGTELDVLLISAVMS